VSDRPPLAAALDAVGDRWTLLVVDALLDRPLRFTDLADAVGGIAPNILTSRLKRLEQEGLVVPTAYSRRPVRFAYELTAAGRDLAGALRLLRSWGARRQGGVEPSHHDACGTPVETRWWCPTCSRLVDDDETGDLRFV
jgi:DNA-binding HxlR family transcriptional regulator